MRIFISVDMEGVAGVATLDQIVRGGSGYPGAQRLMTDEANAAARGAFQGGADEVVISDSHGTMDNLLVDRLDRRVRIVTGIPRPSCMVDGLQAGDALAVFVGYHAAGGAPGVLSHTFSSNFAELRVNGEPMTEAEVNGLRAADLGVPVGVLTGDDEVCRVAEKAFPGIRTAVVKNARGWVAGDSMHPEAACGLIEATVADAVAQAGTIAAPPRPDRLLLEVDFSTSLGADFGAHLPNSARIAPRTVQFEAASPDELIRAVMCLYYLSSVAAQQVAAIAHRR